MGGHKRQILDFSSSDLDRFRAEAREEGWEFQEYRFTDGEGRTKLIEARRYPSGRNKQVKLFMPNGEGRAPKLKWPLYNLPKIEKETGGTYSESGKGTVIFVEGPKCADAAQKVFPGSIVTTAASATAALHKTNLKPLTGRDVLIICDTDSKGRSFAVKLWLQLRELGCKVRFYWREGDDGSDIADWAEELKDFQLLELQSEISKNDKDHPPLESNQFPIINVETLELALAYLGYRLHENLRSNKLEIETLSTGERRIVDDKVEAGIFGELERKRWSGRPSRRHRDVPCWQWC